MGRISLGTITMPHGVSNKETLLWFDEWMLNLSKGIEDYVCVYNVIFFDENHVNDTINYLIRRNWMIYGSNELMSPNGAFVIRMSYDEDSRELLNSLKND